MCDVNLCGVCLCDVNLCNVNLCDFNLCDVNLCDVNLCDVKLCDVNLCDVNLWGVCLCDVSVRVRDVNLCGVCLCDVNLCNANLCNANLCAQLPRTQFTHSKAPNPNASKTSTQNFRNSYWHSYPERNLHTASRQTRMPGRHRRKIFAAPICTATPNAIYTQRAAKPACQQDINAKFSQLLLAQLPRTQFTHSKPPNPNARKTSTRKSSGRTAVHTARRQTRMPAGHQRKIFPAPIGTATPNTIYTQQAAKPACQEDIDAKFSQLLLAQIPQTQFTHSAPPNPHASRTSTQNFPSSYWHSNPENNLHTASHQTRMPARHQHAKAAAERRRPNDAKAYIRPTANAPSPTPATQSSGRAAETKRRQSVHQTPCRCSKSHACHAKAATEPRRPNDAKAYIRPPADAPSPAPATQKQRQSGGDQTTPKRTSDPLQMFQVPHLPRKSSGRAAETKRRQSVHQTHCRCSKSHACHAKAATERRRPNDAKAYIRPPADAPSPTPATQKQRQSGGDQTTPKRTSDPLQMLQVRHLPRKSSGRAAETKRRQSVHQAHCRCSKSHACHAKAATERRRPNDAIRPPADAPSPTPATQKQRQSGGDQTTPKRTSDPLQMLQIPHLPCKSSGRAAETKRRQSVHQTPCRCTKSHACHAKAATEPRRPNDAKAHQTPCRCSKSHAGHAKAAAERRRPNDVQSVHQTPCRCSKSHTCHAKAAAERRRPNDAKAYITPPALQMLQVPRLPRKSSDRAAETKRRQSVHQTPCRCSKSHTCHAKAAAEPKRTSDPLPMLQVPRLPRKSSGRTAETKRRQSVHQTHCRCTMSHACHAKAVAEPRRPNDAKAYADAPSPTPATQKQRQSGGDQTTPKRTSDPLQMLQVPRLPRKSSSRTAETKRRQSVHQTHCRCTKSHACHAKAAAEQRTPRSTKAYIRPPACAASPTPATLCDVKLCDVNLRDVKLCDVNLRDVNLREVNLRDVKLCDVNLCDVKLCDVKPCDVKLCDVKLCDINLCDVNLCDVKLCDVSVGVCVYLLYRSKTS